MAFMVTGSWNTWIQADKPANCGVPSPSQAKKDSTTTPSSGSSANTPKKLRAGASSQLLGPRSEEHTSELQSRGHLVCRLLLEKKKHTSQREHYSVTIIVNYLY